MKKLVTALALAALCAASVRADDEYLRVVKAVPASSNAVVSVSFGNQPVTPVAFRVLGAATNTVVSAAIVDSAAGYRIEQPLVASQSATATNTAISASGYTGVVYPGSRIEFAFANGPGAVVVYAKK